MRRTLALVAILGLMMASCGDDDEAGGGAGDTTETSANGTAGTQGCGPVAFTPDSEDLASDVTATGLSCEEAEAFVRVAGQRTSADGPQEVEVEGYRCVRTRTEQDPLPRAHYECTSGAKRVTFVRT
jgi:hypothetical protein